MVDPLMSEQEHNDQPILFDQIEGLPSYTKECECGYGFQVKQTLPDGFKYYCIGCDRSYFESKPTSQEELDKIYNAPTRTYKMTSTVKSKIKKDKEYAKPPDTGFFVRQVLSIDHKKEKERKSIEKSGLAYGDGLLSGINSSSYLKEFVQTRMLEEDKANMITIQTAYDGGVCSIDMINQGYTIMRKYL